MSAPSSTPARGSLKQASEMLPVDPPPWIFRCIGWLMIAIFASAVAASILVHIPEVERCPFVLIAGQGADPVQAPYHGVLSAVRIAEGQQVAAGEELFVLRSDEIREWRTQFRALSSDLETKQANAVKAESSYQSRLGIKTAEISQVERELAFRENHAETSRELVKRMEKFQGGLSIVELIKYQLALSESEKDLNLTQRALEQVKLDRERLVTERAREHAEELAEMDKLRFRIEALTAELANSADDLLTIRAPYEAVVISIADRTPGSVVQHGQELCQLARLDGQLRPRLTVSEAALPHIAPGQTVRLFIEAFPYQRFGTITGKLDWISPAAVAGAQGGHFMALASLDQVTIRVKGADAPLRVGMNGDAHVLVGQRRLIEYAFEPIRQLQENMRQK